MASFLQNMQELFGRKDFEDQVDRIRSVQNRERSKARKLQEQLDEKEEKVKELERKVMENEKKTDSLQNEINGSRDAADQLVCGVTIQIQEMIDKLNEQMDLLDARTNIQIQKMGADSEKQMEKFADKLDGLDEMKTSVSQLDGMKTAIGQLGKASIAQLDGMRSTSEKMDEIRTSLEQLEEMHAILKNLEALQNMSGQLSMIHQSVREDGRKVDALRADVGEKIHSENVKCYRNVKALFTDMDVKIRQVGLSEDSMQDIRRSFGAWKFFSFFALVDFAGIVFLILNAMGIIHLF